MNKILKIKNFYLIIFLLSVISLLSAVYIEYFLQQIPCSLCIYQRIPYLLAIFVSFFGFNYPKNLFWIYVLIIIFVSSTFLSGYHVGIENNIFKEFSGCTNNNLNITNKLELLNSLNKTLPNCKNVNFRLLGLSLATINLIISLFIVVLSILFIKHEKNK